jgi:AraC family transcriptional regulator
MNIRRLQRVQRALDFIEAHLNEPLTLSCVAERVHVSEYHFARIFRAATGASVMSYIRRRRLSESAHLLRQSDDTVLSIAIATGFGSGEAYSRAFNSCFGINPAAYRSNAEQYQLPLQRKHVMNNENFELAPPEFKALDAFYLVGCADEFEPGQTEGISELWQKFAPRIHTVRNAVGEATYGLCSPPDAAAKDPERFRYIASVRTENLDEIPEGMVGAHVPARNYAVFEYSDGIGPALPRTLQYIFGEWLPDSTFEADGADFEYYDDKFDPATGTGTFYIYVPVRQARR